MLRRLAPIIQSRITDRLSQKTWQASMRVPFAQLTSSSFRSSFQAPKTSSTLIKDPFDLKQYIGSLSVDDLRNQLNHALARGFGSGSLEDITQCRVDATKIANFTQDPREQLRAFKLMELCEDLERVVIQ